jgi:hypothetical protein
MDPEYPQRLWHRMADLMAAVVGVALEEGEGAVNLLGGDDQGELVRQRDAPEGDESVTFASRGVGPAVGWADGEHKQLFAIDARLRNHSRDFFGAG